jgi:hypothetical protein
MIRPGLKDLKITVLQEQFDLHPCSLRFSIPFGVWVSLLPLDNSLEQHFRIDRRESSAQRKRVSFNPEGIGGSIIKNRGSEFDQDMHHQSAD